jgi:ethanolamine utilization cobalamin adenosyltransferase
MGNKKKSVIVDEEQHYDESLRALFYSTAKTYGIPEGKLLSRAMYLAAKELYGEARTHDQLGAIRNHIDANSDDVVMDEIEWRRQNDRVFAEYFEKLNVRQP